MIQTIYLGVNGLLYVIVSLWCAFSPASTARSVGFELVGDQGVAEFTAVYGGLEFALAVFFALAAFYAPFRQAGLAFGVILYGGLVLFRILAIATKGSAIGSGWYFFGLEMVMLVAGLYVFLKTQSPEL